MYKMCLSMHLLKWCHVLVYIIFPNPCHIQDGHDIKDCLSVSEQQIKRQRKGRWIGPKGIGFIEWWHIKLSSIPHFFRPWAVELSPWSIQRYVKYPTPERMSSSALGSFDKQSIYWYMIKYARNHPTAKGYYSFNIIIWINKHSAQE